MMEVTNYVIKRRLKKGNKADYKELKYCLTDKNFFVKRLPKIKYHLSRKTLAKDLLTLEKVMQKIFFYWKWKREIYSFMQRLEINFWKKKKIFINI